MAQLWGGRFTKETDKLVYNFNASISFDQKFYRAGHPRQYGPCEDAGKAGNSDRRRERDRSLQGLEGILADVENGTLADHG